MEAYTQLNPQKAEKDHKQKEEQRIRVTIRTQIWQLLI